MSLFSKKKLDPVPENGLQQNNRRRFTVPWGSINKSFQISENLKLDVTVESRHEELYSVIMEHFRNGERCSTERKQIHAGEVLRFKVDGYTVDVIFLRKDGSYDYLQHPNDVSKINNHVKIAWRSILSSRPTEIMQIDPQRSLMCRYDDKHQKYNLWIKSNSPMPPLKDMPLYFQAEPGESCTFELFSNGDTVTIDFEKPPPYPLPFYEKSTQASFV